MIAEIQHSNCPKHPEGQEHWPFFKWGGFYMAGCADMVCEACGASIMVCEDRDEKPETQASVGQWTRDNFPQYQSPKGRYVAILEESIELGLATGFNEDELRKLFKAALRRARGQKIEAEDYKPETGDLLMNVLAYAEERKFDAWHVMTEKMKLNRSRPKEYYDKKVAEKVAQGIRPDWGTKAVAPTDSVPYKKAEPGDLVTRMLADIPMQLRVSEITSEFIKCGSWTFCRMTGVEMDDYNDDGNYVYLTGSVLL